MNSTTFTICVLLIIIYIIYHNIVKSTAVYVKSDINNKAYLVRDEIDKQQASNLLATLETRINILSNYLHDNIDKYPEYSEYIIQLNDGLKDVIINEGEKGSKYTSYSVNKGEQIVFCLRSRNSPTEELHDINLLMYVALHEIAHVACPEKGHTELFKNIFSFFISIATELSIYTHIPFETDPKEYCGLYISNS